MTSGFVLVAFSYLVGSFPTGVLLARRAGVDVRSEGSGNVGATNVARTAGRSLGALTLAGDLVKGLFPVVLARELGLSPAWIGAVAVAAILGHVYSVFLRFRGGKGVATGFGVLVGLAPGTAIVPLGVFAAVVAASRTVSLASLSAAASAPVAIWVSGHPAETIVAATAIALLISWRHEENIRRLIAGTESRFQFKR